MPMSRRAGGSDVISSPSDLDRSAVRRLEAGNHLQQRRLSRAAGAEDRQQLALRHLKRDAIERDDLAETLADALDPQVGRSRVLHAFFSIQAFHSSCALVPFSAYHASLIQNCLSRYCVGRYGFTLAST